MSNPPTPREQQLEDQAAGQTAVTEAANAAEDHGTAAEADADDAAAAAGHEQSERKHHGDAAAAEEEHKDEKSNESEEAVDPCLRASFGVKTSPSCNVVSLTPDQTRYGCEHVASGAFLRASCCDSFWVCAQCHEHGFTPKQVLELVCMRCLEITGVATAQPVSGSCQTCKFVFAEHYCSICQVFGGSRMYHCTGCTTSAFCRIEQAAGCCVYACEQSGDPDPLLHPGRPNAEAEAAAMREKMDKLQLELDARAQATAAAEAEATAKAWKPAPPVAASGPPPAPPMNPWPVRASLHAHILRLMRFSVPKAPHAKNAPVVSVKCAFCSCDIPQQHASAMCTDAQCDYALCISCMHQQHNDSGRTQSIHLRRAVASSESGAEAIARVAPAPSATASSSSSAAPDFDTHALKLKLILTRPERKEDDSAGETHVVADAAAIAAAAAANPCRACDLALNLKHWEGERESDFRAHTHERAFTACKLALLSEEVSWQALMARMDLRHQTSAEAIAERNRITALLAVLPPAYRAALPTSNADNSFAYPALHEHPLQYYHDRYGGGWGCNVCGESGSGGALACDPCGQ